MRVKRLTVVATILLAVGAMAGREVAAGPVGDDIARTLLYSSHKVEVRPRAGIRIPGKSLKSLRAMATRIGYYGAVSTGSGTTYLVVGNYNAPAAARMAAMAACKARATQPDKCQVVADLLPKGWSQRPLQMGLTATRMYQQFYLRELGPRALAISPGSSAAGMARGRGAARRALAACRRGGPAGHPTGFSCEMGTAGMRSATCVTGTGARDCEIVIRD